MRMKTMVMALAVAMLAATAHAGSYEYHPHDEGWFEWAGNRISSWMPWSSKLGSDWSETHHKVENIYQQSHHDAQRRVEELKEESLRSAPEVQKRIAEIYAEAAAKAERDIEALKHPMLEFVTRWRHHVPGMETAAGAATAATGAKGLYDKGADYMDRVKENIEALPKRLTTGYSDALKQAKTSVESLGAPKSWDEAKMRAAEAYSEAFHKGHGSTRTVLGTMSDMLGRGMMGTVRMAGKAATTLASLMLSAVLAAGFAAAGIMLTLLGMRLISKRRFNKQLNSYVTGPIVAVGQYCVMGNEAAQRKFYDYWSGPAQAYFTRQPGLRKHWMHRGVKGGENTWLCYSEWESIESLRRAHNNPEFQDIKKKAPKPLAQQMVIYQLGSAGEQHKEAGAAGEQHKEAAGTGLRQRASATSS